MSSSCSQRVLSIQSHVVSGYVGNKAAVFPLQLLGFDVDVVNSVHFSNHTGYPGGVEGDVLNGTQLKSVLKGLERNGLLDNIGHVLTGYIGSESFLRAVLDVIKTLRKHNPSVRFVCDPVLGDSGEFYVPAKLVSVYRNEVIPLADVVTPNQFEVEQLTKINIETLEDARKACRALHELGPNLVFITSMIVEQDETITIFASQRLSKENGIIDEVWRVDTPVIKGNFTGTGDLCTALLLGHTAKQRSRQSLQEVMEKIAGTMFSVIQRTAKSSGGTVVSRELKLIQSKGDIENPPQLFRAYQLP